MSEPFTMKQACKLIDHPVTHKTETETETETEPKPTSIAEICLIVGLLHLNEEIEVIVKFIDGLRQYTKNEFTRNLRVID